MRSSISRSASRALVALAVSYAASAQTVQVYSEFTRIDPFGKVVSADRGSEDPREILSPALARNAATCFHVVVSGASGTLFNLYIGLNPEKAVGVRLFKEKYAKSGSEWIPDAVEEVRLPYQDHLETDAIPGQTAQAFLLEITPAGDAPVSRIKVEPEVSFPDRWATYPMEARIVVTSAPAKSYSPSAISAPVNSPADMGARRALKQKLCNLPEKVSPNSPLSIRDFISRNAAQDVAMASVVPTGELWEIVGARDHQEWCRNESPDPQGPEWYLRVRDRIVGAKR